MLTYDAVDQRRGSCHMADIVFRYLVYAFNMLRYLSDQSFTLAIKVKRRFKKAGSKGQGLILHVPLLEAQFKCDKFHNIEVSCQRLRKTKKS